MAQALTSRDREQLQQHGLSVAEVERQLALFRDPPAPLHLERACTPGDGIRRLSDTEREAALGAYDEARAAGRLLKFVPASGAASRMFSRLQRFLEHGDANDRDTLVARAGTSTSAVAALQLLDSIDRFAFRDALAEAFARSGTGLDEAVRRGDARAVVERLVTADGLDYANLPKGLLPFHRYPDEVRTAFDEHLVEAAAYAASADGTCALHFTVSPRHRARFEARLDAVRARYESRYGVRYNVSWSSQKPSTDTIAVDDEGRPFRTADGALLLRPGGHGALLENLNDLQADVVLIKNIDNVTVEDQLAETCAWKKLLAGFLCAVQARVFEHVRALRQPEPSDATVDAAVRFVRETLQLPLPVELPAGGAARVRGVRAFLERPLRVCGMVPNTGEPGGGPAWVRAQDGSVSAQIVERAQIDPHDTAQQRVFETLTHFSPVDFACSVRDADGRDFDLRTFVDPEAVIIAHKSYEGRPLRALEHPGLWNGGMARWLTLFVEVPLVTFNPVKSFTDLLRPAHQVGD